MENEVEIVPCVLAIECAVGIGSVALLRGDQMLASSLDTGGSPSRAEEVLQVIKSVLVQAGLSLTAIDLIAVSVGPGSYSGIRIGIATALGLGSSLSVECRGVSVLDALSLAASGPGPHIVAVAVGKRHIGWSSFDQAQSKLVTLTQPKMDMDADFGDKLRSFNDLTILYDPTLSERIQIIAPGDAALIPVSKPLAYLVGKFALSDTGSSTLQPIYLRDEVGKSGQPVKVR